MHISWTKWPWWMQTAPSGYQGSSDLALQLAVLHAQLCTIFAELDQVWPGAQSPEHEVGRQESRPLVLESLLSIFLVMLYQATRDNLEPLPTILHAIEEGRPVPVTVPMCFPAPHTQGHSR